MKPTSVQRLMVRLLPMREPLLIVGPPGTGKTSMPVQAAKVLDYDTVEMHPVVSDPTDFKGMPWAGVHNGKPSAEFLPFGDLWKLIEAKKDTLCMIEDAGQAAVANQAALMQLILARRINGHKISDKVVFVATTNRREDQAGVVGLIQPLLDRFTTIIELDFDLTDWCNWAIDEKLPFELVGFARSRPDMMTKYTPSRDMKKSPTPRSVAGLGRLLKLGITGQTPDEIETYAGAVGKACALEFSAYLRVFQEIPDVAEIYLNPDTVKVPTKPDVLYALMGALANDAKKETMGPMIKYLDRLPKPEFAALCLKDSIRRHPAAAKCAPFTKWVAAHADLFGAENA